MAVTSFSLLNRLAVVTGGASGIGAGIAKMLAEAGAMVLIADLNEALALETASALEQDGYRAAAIKLDLADEQSIVACCEQVVANYGAPWLLVNNAGLQDRELLLEGTAAEWDRMNAVNSRGPYLMTREIAKAMVEAGNGGRIVNVASAALIGSLIKGLVAYSASKGALLGMSQAAAFELAEYGITVNTVLPGGVMTPGAIGAKGPVSDGPARRALPLGRCEPEDIASAVYFFASPAARRITNQVIAVDAGFSVS